MDRTFGQIVFDDVISGFYPKYVIKRNGKKFNNKYFTNYEQARQYVRKWLRKSGYDFGSHRNPVLGMKGFTIVRV